MQLLADAVWGLGLYAAYISCLAPTTAPSLCVMSTHLGAWLKRFSDQLGAQAGASWIYGFCDPSLEGSKRGNPR